MNQLDQILLKHRGSFKQVLSEEFYIELPLLFDFTENNLELKQIDLGDILSFNNYVNSVLEKSGKKLGAGGYGEDRIMYKTSPLFTKTGEEPRSVHLAVDLWLPAGNAIFAPLNGKIHSFKDNNIYLDYGPTIILEHTLDNVIFYTLYGHLSRNSLINLEKGKEVKAGEKLAELGNENENGSYPSHLHFQIISDMLGKQGDFPGVAKPSEKDYWLNLCPNPKLILQFPNLT
jgi:murein DD-endopeptidase MepM/ murein hydrolase activator NlpD